MAGRPGLGVFFASTFLGAERAPVIFETDGSKRRLIVAKKIMGEIAPIAGEDAENEVKVVNAQYWMGPDITISNANKGRVRAFGRVWDFEGRSAEICQIDWRG